MKRPTKLDWLVYRLFRWWWNPVLRKNPLLTAWLGSALDDWLLNIGKTLLREVRQEDVDWATKELQKRLSEGRIEIRHRDDEIDEVAARGHVHLERLDHGCWTLIIDDGEQSTHLHLLGLCEVDCRVFCQEPSE